MQLLSGVDQNAQVMVEATQYGRQWFYKDRVEVTSMPLARTLNTAPSLYDKDVRVADEGIWNFAVDFSPTSSQKASHSGDYFAMFMFVVSVPYMVTFNIHVK